MRDIFLKECQFLFLLLLSCTTLAGLFSFPEQGFLIALTFYVLRHMWQLKRLHQWLIAADVNTEPPEMKGFWGAVCDKIYHLQRHQKKVQSQLEADVAYLKDSFASLSDAVVMVDKHSTITWCNKAAFFNFGLQFPQDLGQHLTHLFRDPLFVNYFESADFSEGIEVTAPNNVDKRLWLQVTLFGQGDRLIFARDITELTKLELMRQDFVANVSHELRTPLTVISGYIENFQLMSEQLPAMKKPLKQMAQHAQRMEFLLRDLIDLSRLETLPSDRHKTAVSLSVLSHTIIQEVKASLTEPRIIEAEIEHEVLVLGNQQEIHSAMSNLLINACKYSFSDQRIALRCVVERGQVCFSVRDEGVGIDEKHIPRLTERFYRVDPSRSINTGGTGLGLAIVKHVLMRHDAELKIDSQLGKGSTFTCYFPQYAEHSHDAVETS